MSDIYFLETKIHVVLLKNESLESIVFLFQVSNLPVIAIPIIWCVICADYIKKAGKLMPLLSFLFVLKATFGCYFHATLSLFAENVDCWIVIWAQMIAVASWTSKRRIIVLKFNNRYQATLDLPTNEDHILFHSRGKK